MATRIPHHSASTRFTLALDLDGDGRIDGRDGAIAEQVAEQVDAELSARGQRRQPVDSARDDRFDRDRQCRELLRRAGSGEALDLSGVPDATLRGLQQQVGFSVLALRVREHDRALQRDSGAVAAAPADEIEQLDLRPFELAGIRPLFVTDLDNTAWQGDASEVFVDFMAARGEVRPEGGALLQQILERCLDRASRGKRLRLLARLLLTPAQRRQAGSHPPALREALREHLGAASPSQRAAICARLFHDGSYREAGLHARPWLDGRQLFEAAAACCAGHTRAALDALGEGLFQQGVPGQPPFARNLYPDQLAKYRALEHRGVEGWIISAGLDFLARAGARAAGLDEQRVEASVLGFDAQGRATGEVLRNPFAEKDAVALQLVERCGGLPIACYGDSLESDTPMALVVHAVNDALDPAGDGTQTALAPELKATRAGDVRRVARAVSRINRDLGASIEATRKPDTLEQLAARLRGDEPDPV